MKLCKKHNWDKFVSSSDGGYDGGRVCNICYRWEYFMKGELVASKEKNEKCNSHSKAVYYTYWKYPNQITYFYLKCFKCNKVFKDYRFWPYIEKFELSKYIKLIEEDPKKYWDNYTQAVQINTEEVKLNG